MLDNYKVFKHSQMQQVQQQVAYLAKYTYFQVYMDLRVLAMKYFLCCRVITFT